jgi:hypothetical protein
MHRIAFYSVCFQVILNLHTTILMKKLFLWTAVLLPATMQAQYYYKDILSTLETNRTMQTYLKNQVLQVTATGFDARGQTDSAFSELQEIKENGTLWKITTRHASQEATILLMYFDEKTRLVGMTDSGAGIVTNTSYRYNDAGSVAEIIFSTTDPQQEFNLKETHLWLYNSLGHPQKMLRIAGAGDTTEIRLNHDEKGNVIDEQPFRRNRAGEMIYYYYDDDNRLTDIVRYNTRAGKLLPDYLFEYDDHDRVIQKITTVPDPDIAYVIWRYAYDDKGLKTKEAVFDRYKKMTGRIDYQYRFSR